MLLTGHAACGPPLRVVAGGQQSVPALRQCTCYTTLAQAASFYIARVRAPCNGPPRAPFSVSLRARLPRGLNVFCLWARSCGLSHSGASKSPLGGQQAALAAAGQRQAQRGVATSSSTPNWPTLRAHFDVAPPHCLAPGWPGWSGGALAMLPAALLHSCPPLDLADEQGR
jgi:hypothetical protein